jgi:Putative prokaryotic signal transducing protein
MVGMVQVVVAGDLVEAEEIQTILNSAGIRSELEPAVEHHPTQLDDSPQKVLVPEDSLEDAQHAIEAMTDPDELIGGR